MLKLTANHLQKKNVSMFIDTLMLKKNNHEVSSLSSIWVIFFSNFLYLPT